MFQMVEDFFLRQAKGLGDIPGAQGFPLQQKDDLLTDSQLFHAWIFSIYSLDAATGSFSTSQSTLSQQGDIVSEP
jgi:hypothetical protein